VRPRCSSGQRLRKLELPSSPSSQPRGEFAQLDLVVGTGTTASTGRSLTVNYTGWLYDPARAESKGTQFDSGTYTFTLGAGTVIRGWDTGLVGMRVGGPAAAHHSAGARLRFLRKGSDSRQRHARVRCRAGERAVMNAG
jgi:hypothetical protein